HAGAGHTAAGHAGALHAAAPHAAAGCFAGEGTAVSAPGGGRLVFTALVALVLTVLPLPPWLDGLRPVFLVLAVLDWSVHAPRTGDIALGFFAGFALDVF